MTEIVNKFLLAGDYFMPEMHLRQHGFTDSASGDHLQKTNKEYKNSKKQENQDITRRTTSDKVLRDKAFNIDKNPKYDGYQRRLASMVYKFFEKKTYGTRTRSDTLAM